MKLNYRKYGSGEPVLILHGVFGASDNWQTVGKKLSENFAVYLVDLRNHGLSPHNNEMNYPVMARDLINLLNDENLDSAHFVGHSMGGKVAMALATSNPEKVKKLVVVDIAPKYYPPHHQTILDAFHDLDIKSIKSRKEADDLLKSKLEDFGVRQFILKNLGRDENNEFEWKLNYKAIESNIEELGKGLEKGQTFEGPALFISGSKSDYIKKDDIPLVKDHFPKADFIDINAGHWVHAEKPEEVFKAVSKYLS